MKANESNMDRIIRVVGGSVLAYLGYASVLGSLSWIVMAVGVVLILTGAVGFCPIYALLKFKTK